MQSILNPTLTSREKLSRQIKSDPWKREAFLRSQEYGERASAEAVPEKATLERLVEESKAGSLEAFEKLVELYEKRVFNFLCQFTPNSHDAEDLTQETFLKAYNGLSGFNHAYAFSTWLFTIAKRTAWNHFRDHKQFQELPQREEADFDDPAVLLEQKDQKLSLWNLARVLVHEQYETLWLRYGEGLSIAETAKVLRTNPIRVRVLLHRARKNLATSLRAKGIQFDSIS